MLEHFRFISQGFERNGTSKLMLAWQLANISLNIFFCLTFAIKIVKV